jgi:hypothetical protein
MARRLDPDDITDQLSELVNEEVPGDGADRGATDNGDSQSDGMTANRIEVAGIGIELDTLTDEFTGKTWVIPNGKFDDNVFHSSPFDVPNKDPRFHYAFYRGAGPYEEVGDMEAQGFVKVTRKEIGIEKTVLDGDMSTRYDSYYTIGGGDGVSVLMKIPQVLADRRYATQKRLCDNAVEATKVRAPESDVVEVDKNFQSINRTRDEKRAFDKNGSRIN